MDTAGDSPINSHVRDNCSSQLLPTNFKDTMNPARETNLRHDRAHQSAAAASAFSAEAAATALVEAVFIGDRKAATKFGVDPKTIRRWRARLHVDSALAECFEQKKAVAHDYWAERLIPAISSYLAGGVETVQRGIDTPEMLAELHKGLGMLLEAQFNVEILNAKLRQNAPP